MADPNDPILSYLRAMDARLTTRLEELGTHVNGFERRVTEQLIRVEARLDDVYAGQMAAATVLAHIDGQVDALHNQADELSRMVAELQQLAGELSVDLSSIEGTADQILAAIKAIQHTASVREKLGRDRMTQIERRITALEQQRRGESA
jgi:ABC-type transporter Mla subunit MlaD